MANQDTRPQSDEKDAPTSAPDLPNADDTGAGDGQGADPDQPQDNPPAGAPPENPGDQE